MTRLIEILISLAIVFVLFLVVGVFLPSSRFISEKIETNRKIGIVYDTLNSFKRFKDWNAIALRDPGMPMSVSGPESGVGAAFTFDSQKPAVGKGNWTIVESVPNEKIVIDVDNDAKGSDKRVQFLLKPTGKNDRNVEITQTYKVDYGWDLIGRYAGLYVRSHVGDDMQYSLGKLANMLASIPNVDYNVYGARLGEVSVKELPAVHMLSVPAGTIEIDDEKLARSMKDNMEWINRTLAANKLVAAGPMRIITDEQGRENYTFNVALPVRRADAAEDAPVDQPLDDLQLLGPVKYERVPARRAIGADFQGFFRELDGVRNALRAWGAVRGLEPTDRAYEVWKSPIDDSFSDAQFEVYWPVK